MAVLDEKTATKLLRPVHITPGPAHDQFVSEWNPFTADYVRTHYFPPAAEVAARYPASRGLASS